MPSYAFPIRPNVLSTISIGSQRLSHGSGSKIGEEQLPTKDKECHVLTASGYLIILLLVRPAPPVSSLMLYSVIYSLFHRDECILAYNSAI